MNSPRARFPSLTAPRTTPPAIRFWRWGMGRRSWLLLWRLKGCAPCCGPTPRRRLRACWRRAGCCAPRTGPAWSRWRRFCTVCWQRWQVRHPMERSLPWMQPATGVPSQRWVGAPRRLWPPPPTARCGRGLAGQQALVARKAIRRRSLLARTRPPASAAPTKWRTATWYCAARAPPPVGLRCWASLTGTAGTRPPSSWPRD
mmetsp:Transcript_16640/g.42668  ORF Transcript_16640/g.42668 Transcript_16640/m.42668 type:complete len:201 (-) Transcript_16640:896-1498(-)